MKDASQTADGSQISVVIPFRCDSQGRLDNLDAVLRHLSGCLPGADLIVIEDGPVLCGEALGRQPGVRWFGRFNDGAFHRTRLINLAAETLTARRFLCSHDTDVMAYPAGLGQALDLLRGGVTLVFPYDGRFVDLRGGVRQAQIATPDPECVPADARALRRHPARREIVCVNTGSVGGAVLFDRTAFLACGGYHEGFVTWGFEDIELVTRMEKLGHPRRRVAGLPLLHLSHARGRWWRRGPWYSAVRRNARLYRTMAAMSRDDLAAAVVRGATRGGAEVRSAASFDGLTAVSDRS